MKRLLAFSGLIAVLLISCKKDKNEATPETKTDIIVKSAWIVDSYGVDVNMDLMLTGNENETLACTLDNTYTFSSNGTLVRNNGAAKCSTEPNVETGSWQLFLNETKIDIFGNAYFFNSLTNNRMVLYSPGPSSNAIFILKR